MHVKHLDYVGAHEVNAVPNDPKALATGFGPWPRGILGKWRVAA
jgi:hypothetical protein